MKWFGLLVVGLVPLLPASVQAQSIKVADLVGTWVGGNLDSTGKLITTDTLVVRSDSTYNWAGSTGRLDHLVGDSLSLVGGLSYKITLIKPEPIVVPAALGGIRGTISFPPSSPPQLSLTGVGSNGIHAIYKRVGPPMRKS